MRVAFTIDEVRAGHWLLPLLRALVEVNVAFLRAHPRTPSLYQSGVRYEQEAIGEEEWQNIPACMARGVGDCEDLAAWRCAELQARGVRATIDVQQVSSPLPGITIWHIRVRLPNGSLEDPSRRLGMPVGVVAA